MPKNMKKKKNSKNVGEVVTRAMLKKEDGEEYARVEKLLGDRQVWLYTYDGQERRGKIRGAMRKKCWINVGDIVLISLRDFSDKCVDIIHKYNDDEVRKLRKMGELIETKKSTDLREEKTDDLLSSNDNQEEDDSFVFEDL